ncbi:MAG: SDR family NAD(P)-dependent oxidoreductase [Gammaproteobacteria bacterium]
MNDRVLTIVGAGKGISNAVAHRFAREGYDVGLVARNVGKLAPTVEAVRGLGRRCAVASADAADAPALRAAIAALEGELGPTQVLLFNAANIRQGLLLDEDADSLTADFRANVAAVLTAVRAVVDAMRPGAASILVTGGGLAMHVMPQWASLGVSKVALRGFTDNLRHVLDERGIFVGTLQVCGAVDGGDPQYASDHLAGEFWRMHVARGPWEIVI